MTELTDHDRAAYAAVDDALRTAPLAPAPAGLLAAVMTRVSPPPPFRLAWLDYAVSAFLAGMVSIVLVLAALFDPFGLRAVANLPTTREEEALVLLWFTLGGTVLLAAIIVAMTVAIVERARPRLAR